MIAASRYAKALLDLSIEKGQLEGVYADVLQIQSACNGSKEFISFLNSPIINADKKAISLKAIFTSLNPVTSGFLNIVVSKRREAIIPEMTASFIELYKTHKRILTAVVTSANGLDATTKESVLSLIKTQANGEVELVEKVDSSLIGGFILKIGDKQVDKSVSRQLSTLKKELTNKTLN